MRRIFYIAVILSQVFISTSYSGPMESHTNYNVILVHGAGGHKYGMDCADADSIYEASHYIVKDIYDKDDYLDLIGGYGGKKLGLSSKFPFVMNPPRGRDRGVSNQPKSVSCCTNTRLYSGSFP